MAGEHDGEQAALDRAFMALADPVRRAIVARLSRGDATVNDGSGAAQMRLDGNAAANIGWATFDMVPLFVEQL